MKKTTGIGGIFFRCKSTDETKDWYQKHLGLQTDKWGTSFEFRQADNPDLKGFLQWSPMALDSSHIPEDQDFMINYRVENLESLIKELKADGVEILDEIENYDYGKFVHIIDNNGMKVELWEPVDEVFDQAVEGRTK